MVSNEFGSHPPPITNEPSCEGSWSLCVAALSCLPLPAEFRPVCLLRRF